MSKKIIQRSRHFSRRTLLASAIAALTLGVISQLQATTNAPLRVGVSPVFPPMIFKQGKELKGVEVDLAKALGAQLNREIVFVEVPWQDQIDALNEGRTDIIMSSMSVTPARKYVVNFSKPYFLTGQMALVRREDKNNYALGFPYKLNGNVGVLKATTGEFLVQRDFPKSPIKSFTNSEDAAKALTKKKINLFITDSTLVWYLAGTHAEEGLTAVPIPLSEETLAWAMRKQDEALLASVNDFVVKGNQDGTLLKAFRRWTAVGE